MSTSTAPAPLPFTPSLNADPARFATEGYCITPGVLGRGELAATDAALARLMAKSEVRPEHLVEPHAGADPFWLELCRHPKILAAVQAVLGPDLVLLMSHLIVKPAHDGKSVPWHQDEPTWPAVRGADIVTVWLAIDDADRDNGCMRVIPRTQDGHRAMPMVHNDADNSLFDFRVEVTPEIVAHQVPVELAAGSLSIHDGHILHGSEANTSPRRRAAYTMRYGRTGTTRIDTAKHWVPIWVVSGDLPAHGEFRDLRPGRPLG
jgi:ectoine hydroxylase-related dioxygenase (phytanoyl-CoA dioxygenase family)